MTWLGRAVGDRFGPARLIPLLAAGPGYLLFMQDSRPSPADWAVTVAAGVIFLGGGVWPLPVAVAEAALIVAAVPLTDSTPVAAKVVASVSLFELAVRRPFPQALAAGAVLSLAYLAIVQDHHDAGGVLATLYRVATVAVGPLLIGGYLRAARQALAQARARAGEAEERRELAARGARLAERTQLSRELHDLVAHHVASMALRVGVARAVIPGLDPKVAAVLDDVHASATTALADLRRLVAALRDPAAVREDMPGSLLVDPAELPAAVALVADRSEQAGLRVEREVDPGIAALDAVRGLAVLRVVQEGLTNATKHAGAGARARVSVSLADGLARVEVADEGGAGLGPATPAGPGFGLIGLRERIDVLGGTLTAGPSGPGWRLAAAFPARLPSAPQLPAASQPAPPSPPPQGCHSRRAARSAAPRGLPRPALPSGEATP
ncbi:histidine kinase [Streptomyces sp. DSM 44917]|uniref:histidine kinase n=1 Tax=Streptomyces boetiae TaxID=3075541 RepID=A0ABU2LDW5_9ACTN|nr:histidine kinase [Streptomyces sp. DSM 44917]MDT0309472.1 histidine kinase [Streptomyces sp. DSM 44917]